MSPIELLGYAASAGVVLSFAMKSVVRLRTVSVVGSGLYVAYGVIIGAWPVVVTNAVVVALNAANLWRELRPAPRPGAGIHPLAQEPAAEDGR